MIRRLGFAAATAALCFGSTAQAQDIAKSLCAEALKGDGVIDPVDLRNAALGGTGQDTLDYNHDGTISAAEVYKALTLDAGIFCIVAANGKDGRARACSDDAQTALANADNALASFALAKGSIYDVVILRSPTPDELRTEPDLQNDRPWATWIDDRRRFVRLVCRRSTVIAEKPSSPRFLAGADIDSLTVARPAGKGRLKKVTPASISFASDNVADTRTFAITAVVGYQMLTSTRFKLTPFFEYDRSEVRDKKAGTDKLTGKFAAGAVGTFIFGADQVDIAPLYARDLKTHAELLGGRFAWRPGFLYRLDPFRNAVHFACARELNPATGKRVCKFGNGLALWTDFQLVTSVGTVVADGNDPTAIADKDFLRIGPSGALHIYGLSGIAQDLSFDASAKRLFTVSGGGRPVYSLKADLSYWVGGSQNLSITSGYERSRDEDTLEATDKWKVGLGVRF